MIKYNIPSVREIKDQQEREGARFGVVSLFAGGGGSSTGYRMAGGKVLAVNEFIPEAIKTYKANWPDTTVLPGDIRKITGQDILDAIGKVPGELGILDGSPPCSAFSTAGSRDKGWGKVKKYSDAQQENVEDLFFEYIRVLESVRPKVFVAENVAGLTKGNAKGYLNQILRKMRATGYHVECRVLDAQWLGIPQSRARTIFVGVRSDLWRPEWAKRLHPRPVRRQVTLKEAIGDLVPTDTDIQETDMRRYATGRELARLRPGEQSEKYFSLVKASSRRVSPCITATTGSIGAAKPCHWDNRGFTEREVKRIMSVPDDYVLTGSYQQRVERLGRMVPPLMMKAVADNLVGLGVFNEDSE